MIDKLREAYSASIHMLEDGIRKMPDEQWRQGADDYLIPVRLAYHTIVGLEWFATTLPPEEHRKTRRYNLNWMGPVDDLPLRQAMLADVAWIVSRVEAYLNGWASQAGDEAKNQANLGRALYFLRHTQHHLGEFGAAARLLGQDRPAWK